MAAVLQSTGTVLTAGNGTSAALAIGGTAAAGDILVAVIYSESAGTWTAPDGTWTNKADLSANVPANRGRILVYWKRCTGGESGTVTFSCSTNAWRLGAILRISGGPSSGDPWNSTASNEPASGTTTAISITGFSPTASGLMTWVSENWTGGGSWTPPSGMTEQVDSDTLEIATEAGVPSGSVGTLTATYTAAGPEKAWVGQLADGSSGTAATGTAALSLSGSATASEPAAGAITLSGSAVASEPAAGSITLSGSAVASEPAAASITLSGSVVASEPAAGVIALAGSASWTEPGAGAIALAAAGAAAAPDGGAGAIVLSGSANLGGSTAASGTAAVALAGTGTAAAAGAGAGALTLTSTATGAATGAGSASLALAATGTGRAAAAAAATLGLAAAGAVRAAGSAIANLGLSAAGWLAARVAGSATIELAGQIQTNPAAVPFAGTARIVPSTWSTTLLEPAYAAAVQPAGPAAAATIVPPAYAAAVQPASHTAKI